MPPSVLLLIAASVVALVDWWAVATDRDVVERWAKPLTMALLIGVAATVGSPDGAVRAWLVVGASLGLVGDVALLSDGEIDFIVGLAAFALGHAAYTVAALTIDFDFVWALPGIVFMACLLAFRFVSRIVPGARRQHGRPLAIAVSTYAVVISAMVITAWGTTAWVAGLGAMAFALSDWVLGHSRFVGPLPGGRLSIMVPYHVGQTLLIVGLATAKG